MSTTPLATYIVTLKTGETFEHEADTAYFDKQIQKYLVLIYTTTAHDETVAMYDEDVVAHIRKVQA